MALRGSACVTAGVVPRKRHSGERWWDTQTTLAAVVKLGIGRRSPPGGFLGTACEVFFRGFWPVVAYIKGMLTPPAAPNKKNQAHFETGLPQATQ